MFEHLRQLPASDRRELLPALGRLVVTRICLLFGIRRTARWLSGAVAHQAEPDLIVWQRRAVALKRVGRRLPGVACLTQALALRWWMRSNGLDAQIRIGIRQSENALKSHAWVELNDQPIEESPENLTHFTKLPEI